MKILHILGEIDGGGVGAVVLNYMRHIDKCDMEIHVLAFEIKGKREQLLEPEFRNCGCHLMYIEHRNLGYIRHFQKVYQLIKNERYDVVHCHFNIWSAPYLFIAMILGVKVRIAHSHTAGAEYSLLKGSALKLFYPMLYMVTTDKFACGQAAGEYLWGKNTFYTMRNAIDTGDFAFKEDTRKQYRDEMDVPKDVFVVGNISRFAPQKNHDFIVDLANRIAETDKSIQFVLVGGGEDFERIKCEIERRNLNRKFHLLGVRKDIPQLLQAFDIFILPSRYEGLPVAAVEAQASGLITILSDRITREVGLLDSTKYLPIDQGVDVWADELIRLYDHAHISRAAAASIIKEKGYDMECESTKLKQYYINALARNS